MKTSRVSGIAGCVVLFASLAGMLPAQDLPVTNGLVFWLDATDASTLFADIFVTTPIDPVVGAPVGKWLDKSPNQFEAFQFDETRRPTYHDSAMNGLPAVRFNGAEADGMEILFLEVNRPYTAFIVNQYWGNIRGRTLQSTDINWLLGLWNGNAGAYAQGWVSPPGNLPATNNVPYVVDSVGTETSTSFFLNGEDFTIDPNPVGNPRGLGLVTHGMFPGEASDADISEIIIYERALSESELNMVRTYLYEKYDTQMYEPPPPIFPQVHVGKVFQFPSAAALDFEGDFVYAINVGGPGGFSIGDAHFTDGSNANLEFETPGATITVANEIPNWHEPQYGVSQDDENLGLVMQSIRWNIPPGLDITLDVEQGNHYQLQLLFAETCCNRGFDIFIDGEEVVSDFVVNVIQGGINHQMAGAVYMTTVEAMSDILSITLGGSLPEVPDNNPILNGLTLELLPGPPPLGIIGDYNNSGQVEQADLDLVLLNWGQQTPPVPAGWTNDLPIGAIDQEELDKVLLNWGNTAALGGTAAVPEPSAALLLLLATVLSSVLIRRR